MLFRFNESQSSVLYKKNNFDTESEVGDKNGFINLKSTIMNYELLLKYVFIEIE